jgi:hypothetical protein
MKYIYKACRKGYEEAKEEIKKAEEQTGKKNRNKEKKT